MTQLLLVRHGQTEWNREMRWQGHHDVPLSPRGVEEARMVARSLEDLKGCPIWSSDLGRAHGTAREIASATGSEIVTDRRLREVNMGDWQGLTHDEVKARYPSTLEGYFSDFVSGRAPGGEAYGEMALRAWEALESLAGKTGESTAIVVCHGGPIKSIVCRVLGMSLGERWRFHVDNASITRIYWGPECQRLLVLNDRCHLLRAAGEAGTSLPGREVE